MVVRRLWLRINKIIRWHQSHLYKTGYLNKWISVEIYTYRETILHTKYIGE